ncbi:MAG: YdjY domain-containing protein [Planctomycetota bacterium]|nr:YdjY domain-containing protein [Planctomycetota bacterium]MDP6503557.1 YdjY domain-containing protein [Planctomycetota bacterium]
MKSLYFPLIAFFYLSAATAQNIGIDLDKKQVGIIAKKADLSKTKGMIDNVLVSTGSEESSLFVADVTGEQLKTMLARIGAKHGLSGREVEGKYVLPAGDRVKIYVEWLDGKTMKRQKLEEMILDMEDRRLMPVADWVFTGSRTVKDPDTDKPVLEANIKKSLISTTHDPSALIQNPYRVARQPGRYRANSKRLPKSEVVRLLLESSLKESPDDPLPEKYVGKNPRVNWIYSGKKIRGVRFREFIEATAKRYKIKGWVRNWTDGRMEVTAEGESKYMKVFLRAITRGPKGAKIGKIEKREPLAGKLGRFEIRETYEP